MIDGLYQFIPSRFEYLTKKKKIHYKEKNLKSDYIINIIHELLMKFFFSEELISLRVNLWSLILRKKYGMNYSYYIDYLIDNNFISLVSDYYVLKKSKTYKINQSDINDIIRVRIYDRILINKHKKDFLERSITEYNNSPILVNIRKRLVDDLYHVNIDIEGALDYLDNLKLSNKINNIKYFKNLSSIHGINDKYLFFKFDSYGRFHTNYTILKREIRRNFLKIDGEDICEIDIKNSQPFFLSILMKKYMKDWSEYEDVERYFFVVKNGMIYDDLLNRYSNKFKNRDDCKLYVYKVLFGKNNNNSIFKELYPNVLIFINSYKESMGDHRSMSHELQKIESDFIFNNVIDKLYNKSNIRLFTVHDSIIYPCSYQKIIEKVFNDALNILYQ